VIFTIVFTLSLAHVDAFMKVYESFL